MTRKLFYSVPLKAYEVCVAKQGLSYKEETVEQPQSPT